MDQISVAKAAGEWYRNMHHPSVTGKIEVEVPDRADGDGQWRAVLRPSDGSPEVTAAVDVEGNAKLMFPNPTPLKGKTIRITL